MRIAIVNDLPMAVEVLRKTLALRPQHQIAWVASNGEQAVQNSIRDTPDLILMDLIMPTMDGVQATRQIMTRCPCAVVVVTVSVNANASKVFEAMGAGALDAVDTPTFSNGDFIKGGASLLAKIDMMQRLLGTAGGEDSVVSSKVKAELGSTTPLVVIGASAGGPAALATVLSSLPKDFPAAIAIVQHVDEQFAPSLSRWLAEQSAIPVVETREGDLLVPGRAFMAVKDDHLILRDSGRLGYTEHPKDVYYRPSVDVFFDSVVQNWRGEAVGVLLTGMGRDGAKGLRRLRDNGFHTIAQDQATSAVYGMPKAAALLDAAVEILPLDQIGPAFYRAIRKRCFK